MAQFTKDINVSRFLFIIGAFVLVLCSYNLLVRSAYSNEGGDWEEENVDDEEEPVDVLETNGDENNVTSCSSSSSSSSSCGLIVEEQEKSIRRHDSKVDEELVQTGTESQDVVTPISVAETTSTTTCATISEPKPSPPSQPSKIVSLMETLKQEKGASKLTDEELLQLVGAGKIAAYALEKALGGDFERAVHIRRMLICKVEGGDAMSE